jgi:DinB superfamily
VHDPQNVLSSALTELARFPRVLDALLTGLDDAAWRARPVPSEWSPVEIVCHLRDEEVEDFGTRFRVTVDDGTSFVPIDPERWATERRYADDDGPHALAAFRERRAANIRFVNGFAHSTLGPPLLLMRAVEHRRLGSLSGLDILAAWVEHDRLHLAQLAATLARTWATRWAPLNTEYAGPIPYANG